MKKELIHTFILIITIIFSFLLAQTTFSHYDLQIAAFLFIVLYISKNFIIPKVTRSYLLESVVLTLVVLSIINSTGYVSSPYFFLVYFLLFSLSLLLEPSISLSVTLALIISYLFFIPPSTQISGLLPIFSFAFITPFSLYLGEEYRKKKNLEEEERKLEQNTLLFLSLILKQHAKEIQNSVENFLGDSDLEKIKKHARRIQTLIEKFEEKQNQ